MLPGILGAIRKVFMDGELSLSIEGPAAEGGRGGSLVSNRKEVEVCNRQPIGMNLSGAAVVSNQINGEG